MRYALIIDGKVDTISLNDRPDEDWIEVADDVFAGDFWDGKNFVRPEASPKTPADYPLKRWQFNAMVDYLQMGDKIEAAINAISDDLQRAVVLARYKTSDIYDRADPLFDQLAAQIGLSLKDLDAAWMRIATMGEK